MQTNALIVDVTGVMEKDTLLRIALMDHQEAVTTVIRLQILIITNKKNIIVNLVFKEKLRIMKTNIKKIRI